MYDDTYIMTSDILRMLHKMGGGGFGIKGADTGIVRMFHRMGAGGCGIKSADNGISYHGMRL